MTDGRRAEDIACAWLEGRGLRLIGRNHRCRAGELDLVMMDGSTLAVVEVRYRRTCTYGRPEETVDGRKQRRIIAATRHFLHTHRNLAYGELRFDVLAMSASLDAPQVAWLRGAFTAG